MSARKFEEIRDRLGVTQAALAEALGLTDRAVRNYVARDRKIPTPVAKLVRLLDAGKISIDDLNAL